MRGVELAGTTHLRVVLTPDYCCRGSRDSLLGFINMGFASSSLPALVSQSGILSCRGKHQEIMAHTLTATTDLKVPAAKFWEVINRPEVIPKIMPQVVSSCEYIEGDGGVGSIRLMKYGPAVANLVTFSKERIDVLDEDNMKLSYSIIDGELLQSYKTYMASIEVLQGGTKESCSVTWSLECEPINPEVPPPEKAKEGAIGVFKALEAYLLNATLESKN